MYKIQCSKLRPPDTLRMTEVIHLKLLNVLMADDEKELTDTLVERIKMREINVSGVFSGKSALEYLAKNDVDVVVSGVRMP